MSSHDRFVRDVTNSAGRAGELPYRPSIGRRGAQIEECWLVAVIYGKLSTKLTELDTLTFQALTKLNVQRRVILTGTPIQNDLSEYFALLNFANPEYLGTKLDFKKNFESKILRGRDADASEKDKLESDVKLKELGGLVSKFIIRRTNDLLSKYRKLSQPTYGDGHS